MSSCSNSVVRAGRWTWPVKASLHRLSRRRLSVGNNGLGGSGTLYSFTVVHNHVRPAGFTEEMPCNLALVDLDEGVRMVTNIVGVPNDELRVGLPLVVTFERISDELALPKFRPAEA